MKPIRLVACAVVALACAWSPTALAAPTLTEIAREFTGGLVWLDPDVLPAIAEDGTVVFAGFANLDTDPRLLAGNGGALTVIDITSAGLDSVGSVQVESSGDVAFVASRQENSTTFRGVHATTIAGGAFFTLYEGIAGGDPINDPQPVTSNVWMSPNGTLAFSAILNGHGALYRGPVSASVSVLQSGSGTFYNNKKLGVNDAGRVAVQMEYLDPSAGLARGILLFDTPNQTLADIDTAVERMSIGEQPNPSINGAGKVAFAINSTQTLKFFDPPGDASGAVVATITLVPGVYVANPTPWSLPSDVTKLADASGAYASFGEVQINDSGVVAFEAGLDDGNFGVFTGPDAVTNKVLATGDTLGNELFSWIRMGELNNAGQLTLLTSDFNSTDRQVWRVSGLNPPPPKPPNDKLSKLKQLLKLLLAWLAAHH